MEEKQIIYPITKETLHAYAKSIFNPIMRGECVTTVWVPMAGRSMWNKFIAENINLFEKELPTYQKHLLVYVEPLDLTEESLNGYLQLMAKSIYDVAKGKAELANRFTSEELEVIRKHGALYPELLGVLKSMLHKISNEGLVTILFLGEFDELPFTNKIFFNNLKSLWVSLYPNLLYVFPMVKNLTDPKHISEWDELREPIVQNIIYIPMRHGADIDYTIDFFANRHELKVPQDMKKVMREVCGGHPYMLKLAVRAYRNQGPFTDAEDFRKALLQSYELYSTAKGIYNPRSEIEQETFRKIVRKQTLTEEEKITLIDLKKLGLFIQNKDGDYKLFSEAFQRFISDLASEVIDVESTGNLDLDPTTGAVRFNNEAVDEYFTRQEYSILSLFLQKADSIVTRDDIGAILWGEDSYQKYSDWAIDQLISKLRKKIKNVGSNAKILTLRGRGYKFIQN